MKTMTMTDREFQENYDRIMAGFRQPAEPTKSPRDEQGQFKKASILKEGRVTYTASTAKRT
mgnify:CR=1 FL=1